MHASIPAARPIPMRLAFPVLCIAAALASGCVYKIDIQQGNVVIQEQLVKVKPGMTRPEVRQLLGTPLLSDAFHANRWDYWFYNAKKGREVERNKITILFENDKVVRVDGTAPVAIKGEERK
jgi:outer membrane protein assembly factor BamE